MPRHDLLHTLVNEELFKSHERLAALLAKNSLPEALEAEFFHKIKRSDEIGRSSSI